MSPLPRPGSVKRIAKTAVRPSSATPQERESVAPATSWERGADSQELRPTLQRDPSGVTKVSPLPRFGGGASINMSSVRPSSATPRE